MWYITPNKIARRFTIDDVSQLFAYIDKNRATLYEQSNWSIQDTKNYINRCIAGYENKQSFMLGIWSRNNEFIASFGVDQITNKHANIYYWLANEKSNIITDAYSWLFDYLFNNKIAILVAIQINIPYAQKLIKKYNFKPETNTNPHLNINNHYSLSAYKWLYGDSKYIEDTTIIDKYTEKYIIPYFKPCIETPIYATLINHNYEIIMCSTQSAKSIGCKNAQEAVGLSYKDYADVAQNKHHFGKLYKENNNNLAHNIHLYAKKVFKIQQYVFRHGTTANFIDSIPYNNEMKHYLVTFIPIFHPNGSVIGIQTSACDYRLFSYQEHIKNLIPKIVKSTKIDVELSNREYEILFLLAIGTTQEEIAQILNIKRATVASIIRNQLCAKFEIAGSNTKLVTQIALETGILKQVPDSLWHPSIITLDNNLTKWLEDNF